VYRRFSYAYCLHPQGDDGGSVRLWNVSLFQNYYTALYPRRLSSSYPPPARTWNLTNGRDISTHLVDDKRIGYEILAYEPEGKRQFI
jgi:hypothetical protein